MNNMDIVCLRREYGIFGGQAGQHILAPPGELRMPIVSVCDGACTLDS